MSQPSSKMHRHYEKERNRKIRKEKEEERRKVEVVAHLLKKYETAVDNSLNKELIAQYQKMIEMTETYKKQEFADKKKVLEMQIENRSFAQAHPGVDPYDIKYIAYQLKNYDVIVPNTLQEAQEYIFDMRQKAKERQVDTPQDAEVLGA